MPREKRKSSKKTKEQQLLTPLAPLPSPKLEGRGGFVTQGGSTQQTPPHSPSFNHERGGRWKRRVDTRRRHALNSKNTEK